MVVMPFFYGAAQRSEIGENTQTTYTNIQQHTQQQTYWFSWVAVINHFVRSIDIPQDNDVPSSKKSPRYLALQLF